MMDAALFLLLASAGALFAIGLAGMIARAHLVKLVIGLELLGKGVSLIFITAGYLAGDVGTSQAVVFTLIIIEAVIAGVALAFVILAKRVYGTLIAAGLRFAGRAALMDAFPVGPVSRRTTVSPRSESSPKPRIREAVLARRPVGHLLSRSSSWASLRRLDSAGDSMPDYASS